uniref:HTH CENPB-type domain-containing protein n=1 Tax=Ditylenchus dipsaci TaxID=166011 RepID=A0A915DPX5_9BILA
MDDFDSCLYGDDEDHMGWGDQAIVEQIESDDETVALGYCKRGQKKNLAGAGRPLLDKDFDMLLAGWVQERRALKMKVSRTMIMARAQQIFQTAIGLEKETKFAASEGWLQKFLERHAFRARFPTTRCQKPPSEYAQKLVDFVMYVSRIRSKENYTHIYAADETPIWLDPTLGKASISREQRMSLCYQQGMKSPELPSCSQRAPMATNAFPTCPASNGRILLQQAREDADVEMLPLEEIDEYEDQENGYESDVSIE